MHSTLLLPAAPSSVEPETAAEDQNNQDNNQ